MVEIGIADSAKTNWGKDLYMYACLAIVHPTDQIALFGSHKKAKSLHESWSKEVVEMREW